MAELKQMPLGARIHDGPQPWQVIQRGLDGYAEVTLAGEWVGAGPHTVEVRLANEADNAPVPGCDWRKAEPVGEHGWRAVLRAPAGGPYRIESRLQQGTNEWRLTGDKIHHVFVGDIWVIAGQSNAVGYGHGNVYDPPQPGVSVFGGNEAWRLATHPIFDPTGTVHLANRDGGWVDVSPWLAFGRTVRLQTGVPVGLIPAALGGSPLSAWDPGAGEAVLYHNMAAFIRAAGGRITGMLWYQGESDVGADLAATYLERFTRFVERFRADFGAALPVLTAQLNRVLGADAGAQEGWSRVREAQRQAALR
ncbi:MAG TPA: sialate O-acetylesterase, partial [Limnochordia bacterium]|nr:sialate O-acetylesterase [Limnochordia bacterium]